MALEVKKRYPVPRSRRSPHKLPQRTMKREQRKKSAQRTVTSVLVLVVVAVGAGMAYTWYTGQQQQSALANQPAPERTTRAIIKPQKVPSDARVGASVQTITPEVKPGENASLSIRTNPEAECSIVVKYGTITAVDSGLVAKMADEFGVASWSWTVAASSPTGKWPADVTCKNKKHSAMVRAEFTVKP